MRFGNQARSWWWGWNRSHIDYRAEVGDARRNSIVESCVRWIQRTFPEAPVRILTFNGQGEETPQPEHPLKLLLDTPNPFYPGELLWSATLADRTISGNAYWLKVRSGAGRTVQLWWIPSTMIEPRWPQDGSAYISHYDYTPDGLSEPQRIDVGDVVHFRDGLDPNNIRKGLSPLGSLLREIFTDSEASEYTASMLRNVGVPPVVISPGKDARPSQDELDEVKTMYMEKTTGSHRGEPLVMRGETSVSVLGFNPQQMDMRMARRVPEERVSAVLGIPAAVVGLGTGLENTKVGATMAEMREQAYESNIIPTQRLMAAELRTQLLPDFGDVRRLRLDFDLSKVRVLQADQDSLHERAREDLKAGGIAVNEFRQMIGLEPLDSTAGDVLYIPIGVTPTHPDMITGEPPVAQPVQEALPQPAKVLRLPARTQTKDVGDNVSEAIARLRQRLQKASEALLAIFLADQQKRVLARFSAMPGAESESLVTAEDEAQLRTALEPLYRRMLTDVHTLAEDGLRITFELDAQGTRNFLASAGQNITGINATTLQAVREALLTGQSQGETVEQIAQRLSALPEFDQVRATLIARTELAQASNLAAVHVYRSSGVVLGIRIIDGEDFDEPCKARNGKILTLDAALNEPPLLHPRCTAKFAPLTDPSLMEAAA
jgi:HK97 family phage portal protein